MSRVYLLMKHPPYPYNANAHLKAGEVMGVYADRAEPARIAAEKNARHASYLWAVHAKNVKGSANSIHLPSTTP